MYIVGNSYGIFQVKSRSPGETKENHRKNSGRTVDKPAETQISYQMNTAGHSDLNLLTCGPNATFTVTASN
jgi:hypothetical protein